MTTQSPPARQLNAFLRYVLVGNPLHESLPPAPKPTIDEHISFLRAYAGPGLLLVWTMFMAFYVPLTMEKFQGSMYKSITEVSVYDWPSMIPPPTWTAFGLMVAWSFFQGLLMKCLPGPIYHAPVTPAGEVPEFHDNGKLSWLITHALWLILGPLTGIIPFEKLFDHFGSLIVTNNLFGVPFTLFLYWKGKTYPSSRDAKWMNSFLFDIFHGVELHPRLFGLSLKQLLNCRISMMGWSIIFLSFAQAQYVKFGELSSGMFVSTALLVLYLAKFFWWETGYFTSIDVAHDRCGYYIVWGLLTWVPVTYCAPAYGLVENPAHWPISISVLAMFVGLVSLWINWDADHQRQYVREKKGKCLVWGQAPKLIVAKYTPTDGVERSSLLLYSGYWGISRHFHYVPELVLALMISLPAGLQNLLPMIYFIFLFCLLVDRASRDDDKCRKKYGPYWVEYCKHVPYKIVPFLY